MQPEEQAGIYKINCIKCKHIYIGMCSRSIKTRFTEQLTHRNNNAKMVTHLQHSSDITHINNYNSVKKRIITTNYYYIKNYTLINNLTQTAMSYVTI